MLSDDFVGPLGCPSEFVHEDIEELKKKKMLFVAGGVGTAPVYPQVKWLKEHGIDCGCYRWFQDQRSGDS